MTIKIEDLEFGAILKEDGTCQIEIIYGQIDHSQDSTFVDIEELKAAIKFLETEVNR